MESSYHDLRARHRAEFQALVPEHQARLAWDAERIALERQTRLRTLLAVARTSSRWHSERLSGVDVENFNEADLPRVPVMTKDDLMTHFDDVVTDTRITLDLAEAHLATLVDDAYLLDEFHVFASGGSSGRRGVFVQDWQGWLWLSLALSRFFVRQRSQVSIDPEATEVVVAAGSASHMTGATTFQSPYLHRVPATLPLEEIVARLNSLQPVILRGYPTALAALAAEQASGRLRVAPAVVRAHSEPLLPEARKALEAAWGRPVLNAYGTTEGACGGSCGAGEGLHLNDDLCVFELVDEADRPVPAGERSAKVYVTNLINLAQPLIRYELNDEMRAIAEPCPCGSALLRVADIEGRTDDCFSYPTALVHPMVFRSVLGREPNIVDYQVRQTTRGADIDIRSRGRVDPRGLASDLTASLAGAGVVQPVVRVKEVHSFEKLTTGKIRRFFPLADTPGRTVAGSA